MSERSSLNEQARQFVGDNRYVTVNCVRMPTAWQGSLESLCPAAAGSRRSVSARMVTEKRQSRCQRSSATATHNTFNQNTRRSSKAVPYGRTQTQTHRIFAHVRYVPS